MLVPGDKVAKVLIDRQKEGIKRRIDTLRRHLDHAGSQVAVIKEKKGIKSVSSQVFLREILSQARDDSSKTIPKTIDAVALLLDSRFSATGPRAVDRQEGVGAACFEEHVRDLLLIGIAASAGTQDGDLDERRILLGLAAALGLDGTVLSLWEAGADLESAQANIESGLLLWRLDDNDPQLEGAFGRLMWRRTARRLAFTISGISDGTFSMATARVGYEAELAARRSMLSALTLMGAQDGAEGSLAGETLEALARMAGVEAEDCFKTPAETENEVGKTLARAVADPGDRRLLLAEFITLSLIDHEITEEEVGILETIADAVGVSPEKLLEIESEVARDLSQDPARSRGFAVAGILERVRRTAMSSVKRVIKKNVKAIVNELRETGDLVALLGKSTSEKLTEDEELRVKEQLQDLCRAVPCLALFAAPGGSILIPVLQRFLPINVLPSSFTAEDEDSEASKTPTRDDLPTV